MYEANADATIGFSLAMMSVASCHTGVLLNIIVIGVKRTSEYGSKINI